MAITFERLIDVLDVDVDVEEAAAEVVEVSDAPVVDTVAAGDADPVALAVEAMSSRVSTKSSDDSSTLSRIQHHVPAVVVVATSPGTPMAQYASNTSIALEACAETIDESQDCETAEVIMWLMSELESVQKHV